MKTFIAAASFALTLGLSGLAHAGFNDQGPTMDTTPARPEHQALSQAPTVHGFNRRTHHAAAARVGTAPMTVGLNGDLSPRVGFQNSSSGASC
ncbi:MAG: hypothetical protein KDJ54_02660 [Candidatus Competibacteraceae bacterium]|nr:hypothetical protein [Candidatus Competibacteraceae bacterium]